MIKKHMVTYPNQFGYFHSESSSAASLYKAPRVFLCGDINTNMNSELEVMGMSLKHNESSRRSSDAQRDPEQKLEIYYQGKHELFTFLTHIPPENFTNVRDIVTGKVDSNVVVPEGHFTGTCASNAYLKHLFAIETGKRPTDYKCPTTDFDKSYNITEPKGKLIDVISPNYIDHENLNETFSVEIQDVVGISDHHLLKARYSLDLDALITYAGGDQHTNIEAIKVQRSMSVLSDLAKEAEKAEKSHTSSPLSPLTEVKTVQQQPKTVHDEFEDSSDESCVTGPNSNSNSGRATPVLVQDGAVKATTTVPVTATGDKPKPRLSMDTTAVANSSSTTPVVLTSNSESTENSE
jgi:hypothetical protein